MTYPRTVATEAELMVLEQADRLATLLEEHWSHPYWNSDRDDVMLLVADLLRAHADTGIEMQTWRRALDVVVDHLAADPDGLLLLRRLDRPTWFTVVGTWRKGQRECVAVIPGRRRPDTTAGCWIEQVQAPTAADAVRATSHH